MKNTITYWRRWMVSLKWKMFLDPPFILKMKGPLLWQKVMHMICKLFVKI